MSLLLQKKRRIENSRVSEHRRPTKKACIPIPFTILEEDEQVESSSPTETPTHLFTQCDLKQKRTPDANIPTISLKSWSRMLIPQFFWKMVNCLMLFDYMQGVLTNDFRPCKCGCILKKEIVCKQCNWSYFSFLFNKRERAVDVLTVFISDISRIVRKVSKDIAMLLRYELVIQVVKLHIDTLLQQKNVLDHLHTIFISSLRKGLVPFGLQDTLDAKWKADSIQSAISMYDEQLKLYNENILYLGGAPPAQFKEEVKKRFSASVSELL